MTDLAALQARVTPEFEQIVHALTRLVLPNAGEDGGTWDDASLAAHIESGHPRSTVGPELGEPTLTASTGIMGAGPRVGAAQANAPVSELRARPPHVASPWHARAAASEVSREGLREPPRSPSQAPAELPVPRAKLRPPANLGDKPDIAPSPPARLRLAAPRASAQRPSSPPEATTPASAPAPSKSSPFLSRPVDRSAARHGAPTLSGKGGVPADAPLAELRPQWPAPRLLEGAPWRADGANAPEAQPDPFADAALEQRIADLLTEAARASGLDY